MRVRCQVWARLDTVMNSITGAPAHSLHQLNAFTGAFSSGLFTGNPAAYVPLLAWPPDSVLSAIAAQNNLSETAFTVPAQAYDDKPTYHLRWFTPKVEVALCGHATLATAAHLLERDHPTEEAVAFNTRSGWLSVSRGEHERYVLDLPAQMPERIDVPEDTAAILGAQPVAAWQRVDHLYVFDHEATVAGLAPDMAALAGLDVRGVIVTAPADDPSVGFVSRFFAPGAGVPEDPVTGSAHTKLVPYWAARLNKTVMHARQISPRGGDLWCELRGDRVLLAGSVERYLDGMIWIPPFS